MRTEILNREINLHGTVNYSSKSIRSLPALKENIKNPYVCISERHNRHGYVTTQLVSNEESLLLHIRFLWFFHIRKKCVI